jgi:hypothetical protein
MMAWCCLVRAPPLPVSALVTTLATAIPAAAQAVAVTPAASGTARVLRVQQSPELRCPSRAELRDALSKRLPTTVRVEEGVPVTGESGLYAAMGPRHLYELSLWVEPETTSQAPRIEHRELDGSGASCHELADAMALMTAAWLEMLPGLAVPEMEEPLVAGRKSIAMPPSVSSPRPAETGAPRSRVRLRVSGGFSAGLDPAELAPALSIALDVGIAAPLGIGIEVDWLGSSTHADPLFPTRGLVVRRQAIDLYLGWWPAAERVAGLELLFGLQLRLVEAAGTGYPVTQSQFDTPVGAWTSAVYELSVSRWLGFFGQGTASASFSQSSFYASDPGAPRLVLYTLPLFALGLSAGAVLRF